VAITIQFSHLDERFNIVQNHFTDFLYIALDIKDIAPHFKQNHNSFRHLGFAYHRQYAEVTARVIFTIYTDLKDRYTNLQSI
jgi:hypothetical protein